MADLFAVTLKNTNPAKDDSLTLKLQNHYFKGIHVIENIEKVLIDTPYLIHFWFKISPHVPHYWYTALIAMLGPSPLL